MFQVLLASNPKQEGKGGNIPYTPYSTSDMSRGIFNHSVEVTSRVVACIFRGDVM